MALPVRGCRGLEPAYQSSKAPLPLAGEKGLGDRGCLLDHERRLSISPIGPPNTNANWQCLVVQEPPNPSTEKERIGSGLETNSGLGKPLILHQRKIVFHIGVFFWKVCRKIRPVAREDRGNFTRDCRLYNKEYCKLRRQTLDSAKHPVITSRGDFSNRRIMSPLRGYVNRARITPRMLAGSSR